MGDLAVVSTHISAFLLVCVRMWTEVFLFLWSLFNIILAFSCGVSVLKQDNEDFAGIHKGIYALLRMVLSAYDAERYTRFHDDPIILLVAFVFIIATVVFLLSMLIAQLSCAYSSVYADMVGYARLERAGTIVEIMPQVSSKRWRDFVASL